MASRGLATIDDSDRVRAELRRRLSKRGAAKVVAHDLGISVSHLSGISLGRRSVPDRVIDALGFARGSSRSEVENAEEVVAALRERLAVRGAAKQIAEQAGCTTALLTMIKQGHRRPNLRIAEALGFRRVVRFERAE